MTIDCDWGSGRLSAARYHVGSIQSWQGAVKDGVNPHCVREFQFECEFAFADAIEDLEWPQETVVELWRWASGRNVPARQPYEVTRFEIWEGFDVGVEMQLVFSLSFHKVLFYLGVNRF
jgi:hypothetical protein